MLMLIIQRVLVHVTFRNCWRDRNARGRVFLVAEGNSTRRSDQELNSNLIFEIKRISIFFVSTLFLSFFLFPRVAAALIRQISSMLANSY